MAKKRIKEKKQKEAVTENEKVSEAQDSIEVNNNEENEKVEETSLENSNEVVVENKDDNNNSEEVAEGIKIEESEKEKTEELQLEETEENLEEIKTEEVIEEKLEEVKPKKRGRKKKTEVVTEKEAVEDKKEKPTEKPEKIKEEVVKEEKSEEEVKPKKRGRKKKAQAVAEKENPQDKKEEVTEKTEVIKKEKVKEEKVEEEKTGEEVKKEKIEVVEQENQEALTTDKKDLVEEKELKEQKKLQKIHEKELEQEKKLKKLELKSLKLKKIIETFNSAKNDVKFKELDEGSRKSIKKGFVNFSVIVGILILLIIASTINGENKEDGLFPDEKYIARLNVEGVISSDVETDFLGNIMGYNHTWTLDSIDDLIEDENNAGLILYVDSPGGGVYESDELYLKILEYKSVTGRPVYAVMGRTAASGGYYISAPCDMIYANRNCITGSIGVRVGPFYDLSGLFEEHGIKTTTITSGRNKAMGDFTEPMTEEQRAIFQSIVDESYNQFLQVVSEGRNIGVEKLRPIADGRIYTAKQALDLNLIDVVGNYDEAFADMQEYYELNDAIEFNLEENKEETLFGLELKAPIFKAITAKSDLAILEKLMDREEKIPVNYIMN